jgi:hypothetical protein
MKFVPLAPEEMPGNPDLGGWRPLTVAMLREILPRPLGSSRRQGLADVAMPLEQSLHLLAFAVNYIRTWQQVQGVAQALSATSSARR